VGVAVLVWNSTGRPVPRRRKRDHHPPVCDYCAFDVEQAESNIEDTHWVVAPYRTN